MVSALGRRPLRLCRAFKGLASRGYAAFEQLETARHFAVAPVSDLQPSRMISVFILPRLHRLHSSRWPACGRSPTGPPDMAVKHARRGFPAPGLLSQTGMEPVTRDSVQHTSPSRRKAASLGPRASQRPSPRVNPGPSALPREPSGPEHTANALGRCCSNYPPAPIPAILSRCRKPIQ